MGTQFTVEESNLICVFTGESREDLIKEMNGALPYVVDEDMKDLTQSVLKKLESMTDEEFAELHLEAAE